MELLPVLTDPHGRRIRKLRVQLTDVCNFRCTYCMPLSVRFQPSATLVPPDELVAMVAGLVGEGVTQVRLTGGEPFSRREFQEIAEGVGALPLQKYGLTTNGHRLAEHLPLLDAVGCRHVNVSLDSLRAERFEAITRTPFFDRVVGALLEAKAAGFPVKVNCVLIRGANDDEVEDFLAFSARHGIPVRFLEYMKIGPQRGEHDRLFVSAGEIIDRLRQRHALVPVGAEPDATAFSFRTDDGAEVGFIASESRPFCATCSRLRLTARGHLRACLMSEDGRDLRGVPPEHYAAVLTDVMAMKPTGRIEEIAQPMHEIGG
ncbi:GTP 3',8-cyclase MoaA [Rubrivirga sp. S365]|uniref:GTP 3',8-cyclase n=1 Tax=Rubrivirga litoralis TaxID=3075598 RepID=A0ABU3BQJ1_9BACT|nr:MULTISPECIES: GTP 3',8-cyclase MoaA [unclassified Rubrivirga]MDT0631561.1 GTP 3',8-cyclase MoaA [Rubrivirga sp. F394]MDT7857196.1 GTP 3',8-cyclase MoaA [Rubrivirga sp. S365]